MTTTVSPTLAGPIADHCVQGFQHTGTPVGHVETIAGVETYVSDPPAGSTAPGEPPKVILYYADIYSSLAINAKLLQDHFAAQGFHVLGLDYFFGDPIQNHTDEPGFDRAAWSAKSRKQANESTPAWIAAVRERFGPDAKYSAVGYCFGAMYAMDAAASGDFVAAAFAHPSALNEDHFKNVKNPLLLSCAEVDGAFPAESRHRAEAILAEIKAKYLVQVFSGVSHGFATRGDPADENARWAKEESARSVVGWFKRFSKA